MEGKAGAEHCY